MTPNLYTGISGSFLREYASHAVRDHIVDEMNIHLGWDTDLRIYPILDAVLGISRTAEEGAWARGRLRFVEPGTLPALTFLARFPKMEQPGIDHYKHVRKLLQAVEHSDRVLVSDGKSIIGITRTDVADLFHYRGIQGRAWVSLRQRSTGVQFFRRPVSIHHPSGKTRTCGRGLARNGSRSRERQRPF